MVCFRSLRCAECMQSGAIDITDRPPAWRLPGLGSDSRPRNRCMRLPASLIDYAEQSDFEFGAFPPPVAKADDTCYISDHTDIAIGLNAKSANADAAKTFLAWVASPVEK